MVYGCMSTYRPSKSREKTYGFPKLCSFCSTAAELPSQATGATCNRRASGMINGTSLLKRGKAMYDTSRQGTSQKMQKYGKLHWSWTNPLMWGLFWWYNKNTAPWINSPTAQVRENQDYDQESRVLNEAIITNSVRFGSTSPSTYLSGFQQFLKNQQKLNLIIHTLRNVKMPRSEKKKQSLALSENNDSKEFWLNCYHHIFPSWIIMNIYPLVI
jgi:hypothetical protein